MTAVRNLRLDVEDAGLGFTQDEVSGSDAVSNAVPARPGREVASGLSIVGAALEGTPLALELRNRPGGGSCASIVTLRSAHIR